MKKLEKSGSVRPTSAIVSVRHRGDDEAVGCSLKEYKILSEIGKGAYGTVYKVSSIRDNNIYCLKKISIAHLTKNEVKEVIKEAKILRKVEHKHIIRSLAHFIEDDFFNIIMEYAENGDLQNLVKNYKERGIRMSEGEIWRIAYELCQALAYLHDSKI